MKRKSTPIAVPHCTYDANKFLKEKIESRAFVRNTNWLDGLFGVA
jgi:hypothetical protein